MPEAGDAALADSLQRGGVMRQESKYVNRRLGLVLIPLYVVLAMQFFWVVCTL